MDIGPVRRRLIAEPVVAPVPAEPERPGPEQADEHPGADAVVTTTP